jgi:hypothetical protein
LRLQEQREGRITADVDPFDRIHLDGDVQAHGKSGLKQNMDRNTDRSGLRNFRAEGYGAIASVDQRSRPNCSRVVTLTKTAWSQRATLSILPNGVFLRRAS